MLVLLRWILGGVAAAFYLAMGARYLWTILPEAGGHLPPDFRPLGYDAAAIAPFAQALTDEARAAYGLVLQVWDRAFIVALALWIGLAGWRGGRGRWVLAGLAACYALFDLAENRAIWVFLTDLPPDPAAVAAASRFTVLKYLALLAALAALATTWRQDRT